MPTGLWTDYKASSFNGGNGTSTNPYQIATAAQLAYLAYGINNGIYFFADSILFRFRFRQCWIHLGNMDNLIVDRC